MHVHMIFLFFLCTIYPNTIQLLHYFPHYNWWFPLYPSYHNSTFIPHLWSKRPQVLPEIREPPIWPQHVVPAVPLGILRRGRDNLIGKSYRFLLATMQFFPWFFSTWGRLADLKCWNRWTHLGHTRNPNNNKTKKNEGPGCQTREPILPMPLILYPLDPKSDVFHS